MVVIHYSQGPLAGGVGIFGFTDLANFWFGFSVFALKNFGFFGFGVLSDLWVFVFLSTVMAVFFLDFSARNFTVFLVCQGSYTLQSRQNCNSKGPLTVRGMHDKPSLFSEEF